MDATIKIWDSEGNLVGTIISKDGKVTVEGDYPKINAILWGPLKKP